MTSPTNSLLLKQLNSTTSSSKYSGFNSKQANIKSLATTTTNTKKPELRTKNKTKSLSRNTLDIINTNTFNFNEYQTINAVSPKSNHNDHKTFFKGALTLLLSKILI